MLSVAESETVILHGEIPLCYDDDDDMTYEPMSGSIKIIFILNIFSSPTVKTPEAEPSHDNETGALCSAPSSDSGSDSGS
jgi:hypothetical protein